MLTEERKKLIERLRGFTTSELCDGAGAAKAGKAENAGGGDEADGRGGDEGEEIEGVRNGKTNAVTGGRSSSQA